MPAKEAVFAMGRIHLLEDAVINKIAAGEVVERPASVVKELVENALDAGATNITVELEEGGRKRITVRDNGCGLSRDDVPKALLRHATSKIQQAEDLFAIASMGFRGEALASIASVSRLTLQTRERQSTVGTRLTADGGVAPQLSDWNGPEGTEITVCDLFFNVPARARFLKSSAAEMATIHELMQGLAMAHPDVGFSLQHNSKLVFEVTAVTENPADSLPAIRERASQVLTGVDVDALLAVNKQDNYGSIVGLVSAPGQEKGSGKWQFTFINGRLVKDRALRSAILRGYHSHLLKGRYPVVVLNISMDPSLVDVNVHPAKTEVRFQYANDVQALVAMAIRGQLRHGAWTTGEGETGAWHTQEDSNFAQHASPGAGSSIPTYLPPVFRESSPLTSRESFSEAAHARGMVARAPGSSSSSARAWSAAAAAAQPLATTESAVNFRSMFAEEKSGADFGVPWSELTYLGSFARCFLLFETGERLLAVDQHAFHERVLYERLVRNESLLREMQRLLVPESVSLSAEQVARLREHATELRACGVECAPVDATTVDVTAVPSLLMRADVGRMIEQLADDLANHTGTMATETALHPLLSTMACHAAVRAGEELCAEDLQLLLREAADVDFVHNCPHGRRVFRWFSHSQVAAWFDR